MAGVGGDALGGVDGGCVAEFDALGDIVGGQGELVVVAEVPHVDAAVAVDGGDGPPVAVADPGGFSGVEGPVVASSEDDVPDGGLVAVGQVGSASGAVAGDSGGAGGGSPQGGCPWRA